jgi:hypothetical protein
MRKVDLNMTLKARKSQAADASDTHMTPSEMVLLTRDKLQSVLSALNISTRHVDGESRHMILHPETNEQATCVSCKDKLHTENIGHIAHGSFDFYCKNPACFGHFVAKRKLW